MENYYLPLKNSSHKVLVDSKGYELCKGYKWKLNKKGYATCPGVGRMHRFITGCPKDKEVHHRDRNKLNNKRSNLQVVTTEEHRKIHGKKA